MPPQSVQVIEKEQVQARFEVCLLLLGARTVVVWTIDRGDGWRMKETELWMRLDSQLGRGYSRVWSAEHSLAELGGRTVDQAIDDGISFKVIWRAVWGALELPASER